MSAETEHWIPKLVKAPLINPHGKYRSMAVVWAAVSPNGAESFSVESVFSVYGSRETRVSHWKRLSWRTKVPCMYSSEDMSVFNRKEKIGRRYSLHHPMICFQIVNLFLEQLRPKVFADKFDCFKMITKSRALHGISEYEQKNWFSLQKHMHWSIALTKKTNETQKTETDLQRIKIMLCLIRYRQRPCALKKCTEAQELTYMPSYQK